MADQPQTNATPPAPQATSPLLQEVLPQAISPQTSQATSPQSPSQATSPHTSVSQASSPQQQARRFRRPIRQLRGFDEDETGCLIGIELKHGDELEFRNEHLVTIDCPRLSISCAVFRTMMFGSSERIPMDFRFLTRNGWPVQLCHESEVEVDLVYELNTVQIQKPRDIYKFYDEFCCVGILLKDDGYATLQNLATVTSNNDGFLIGSVTFPVLPFKADEFRYILKCRISALPENFIFLTKEGFPLPKFDEKDTDVDSRLIESGLITIQQYFDIPRLGLKWHNGPWIGYISINYNATLTEVRRRIYTELSVKFAKDEDYEFLQKDLWPISKIQEGFNTVFDVCIQNFCVIQKLSTIQKSESLNQKTNKRSLECDPKQSKRHGQHFVSVD